MCTIPTTCPHWVRTLMQRGQGNQRSTCLYFALPSEQAVNLWLAPAYLGACHPSPAQGERHHTPQPSLLLLRLPLSSVLLGWLEEVAADWIILSVPFLPSMHSFAVRCHFSSVACFLSGSHSESVSACCIISYQLWHWSAIAVRQKKKKSESVLLLVLKHICGSKCPELPFCFTYALFMRVRIGSGSEEVTRWDRFDFQSLRHNICQMHLFRGSSFGLG